MRMTEIVADTYSANGGGPSRLRLVLVNLLDNNTWVRQIPLTITAQTRKLTWEARAVIQIEACENCDHSYLVWHLTVIVYADATPMLTTENSSNPDFDASPAIDLIYSTVEPLDPEFGRSVNYYCRPPSLIQVGTLYDGQSLGAKLTHEISALTRGRLRRSCKAFRGIPYRLSVPPDISASTSSTMCLDSAS